MSIPLFWKLLPKRGNSSSEERIEIVSKAIKLLGKENITSILGDREFVGINWFKYLCKTGIVFRMRIKSNTCIDSHKTKGKYVAKIFRALPLNKELVLPKGVIIYKQTLYLSGMRLKDDYLIIASNLKPNEAIYDYKKRWTIEKLFSHLKTKGFNFEDTHLTDSLKIKKIIAVITIAFVWSYLVGVWIDNQTPIKLKKHGRLAISYFKCGLNYLVHIIENIQFKHNLIEFNSLLNFLSCT